MRTGIIFLVLFQAISVSVVKAQTDSLNLPEITSRDTFRLNNYIIKTLVPNFQETLRALVSIFYEAEDVPAIISGKVERNARRIFLDSKVIIESDINPGDHSLSVSPDMKVVDYLTSLAASYEKTDTLNIFFNNIHVTPLKRTSFFFYEVYYDCIFGGRNKTVDQEYPRFSRKLTVEVVNEQGWKAFISGVSFSKTPPDDTSHVYLNIKPTAYEPSDLIDKEVENIENRIRSIEFNRDDLISEGDNLLKIKSLNQARQKFVRAREMDVEIISLGKNETRIREIRQRIQNVDLSMEDSSRTVKDIQKLRKEAIWEFDRYRFEQSNKLCDLYLERFPDSDPNIDEKKKRLVQILSNLARLDDACQQAIRSREKKDIKKYEKLSDRMMSPSSGGEEKVLMPEVAYRRARYEMELDSEDISTPQKFLGKALLLSNDAHPAALLLLSDLEVRDGKFDKAIGHMTILTTSPLTSDAEKALYFRNLGDLYLTRSNPLKALECFASAVRKQNLSNELDASPFISKSRLEYELKKYEDCITTCDSGLVRLPATALLHFYKGCSLDKTGKQAEAGNSFRRAVNGGLQPEQKKVITNLSLSYLSQGETSLSQGREESALDYFTSSVYIDSNQTALYRRAGLYLERLRNMDAINDVTALLAINRNYAGAHLIRGIALIRKEEYEAAALDFSDEILLDNLNASALVHRGWIYKNVGRFGEALKDFEGVMKIQPSDTAWGFLIMCAFKSGDFKAAIAYSKNKYKKVKKDFNLYYYAGRSYLSELDNTSAISSFKKASEFKSTDPDLHWFSGQACEAAGKYKEAFAFYSKYQTGVWQDTAMYRMAMVCLKRKEPGDYKNAVDNLGKYIQNNGQDAGCDAIGWYLFSRAKAGLISGTAEYSGEWADKCLNSGPYYYGLAFIRASESNKSATLECLDKALRMNMITKKEAKREREFGFLKDEPGFLKLIDN